MDTVDGGSTYRVGVQALEQLNRLVEEVKNLLLRGIVGVAVGIQRADTGSVLAPFMLPEGLVIPRLVFPICVHVIQEAGCAVRL